MHEYIILLRGGDERLSDLNEAQSAEHMGKWVVFMSNLAKSGKLLGGLPLQASGRYITKDAVSDNIVLTQSGEAISGYLIVKAVNYEQAITLMQGCPIFDFNGNLEVREMAPMEK